MSNLYNLPGLGDYFAAADRNAAASARNLHQGMQFLPFLEQQRKRRQLEEMAELAAGDPNKLMEGYLRMGDAQGAAQVAQVAKVRQEIDDDAAHRRVLSGLAAERQHRTSSPPSTGGAGPDQYRPGAAPWTEEMQAGPTTEAATRMEVTGVNPLTARTTPAPRSWTTEEQFVQRRSAAVQEAIDRTNAIAERLEAAGAVKQAQAYRNKALEYQKLLPTFRAGDRETLLPDGRRATVRTNTFGEESLSPFGPAPKQDELDGLLANLGIDKASPLYRQLVLSRATKLATHQPAASNNVTVHTDKSFFGNMAEVLGKDVANAASNARGAVQTINTLNQIRAAIDSGQVIAGPGTTARQWLGQLGQVLGVAGANETERLTQTRKVIQGLAQLELDAAQLMRGQGAITEAERGIIRRAASGDIDSMSLPELQTLTVVMDKTARRKIATNAANVQRLRSHPSAASMVDFMNVEMPPPYQPGHTPAVPAGSQRNIIVDY